MKKKIIGIIVCMLLILTIMPITNSQKDIKGNNNGKTLIGFIYIELDPYSTQAKEILDNFHNKTPQGMLTNIDIIVANPNQEPDHDLMIAPLRTIIGELVGGGPFFNPITPEVTTIIHVKLFFGNIQKDIPHAPNMLIVDGLAPLLAWEY
jgi:hypothetical protein